MIFRAVGDGRPYPEHGLETARDWADVPPRMVRLDELVTTKRNLDLATLLSEESTFYGDLFAHVVQWKGTLYLEDGLHRALRAALLAEDRGFEPLRAFTQHAFQACALGHYANPPSRRLPEGEPHSTIGRSGWFVSALIWPSAPPPPLG